MNTTSQPNYNRACAIAILGEHSINLLFEEPHITVQWREYLLDLAAKGISVDHHADIIMEIHKPSFGELMTAAEFDLDAEINSPIALELHDKLINAFPDRLDKASFALLKTAYDKLNLYPANVKSIINVAKTIAYIDKAKCIRVEHIAEAIQYQSSNLDDPEYVSLREYMESRPYEE